MLSLLRMFRLKAKDTYVFLAFLNIKTFMKLNWIKIKILFYF